MPSKWMKNNTEDIIWWLDNGADTKGEWVFSFDKKRRFSMFADYPWKLTPEQKEVFDRENPYWRDFFSSRQSLQLTDYPEPASAGFLMPRARRKTATDILMNQGDRSGALIHAARRRLAHLPSGGSHKSYA